MIDLFGQAGVSEGMGFFSSALLVVILFGIAILLFILFASRYKRCPSNRILVIYGKTGRGAAKCVHGGAAFVWPLIQSYDYLDLEPFVIPIDLTSALSQENIRVAVPTTVTAAISNEPGIMENAAIRLLGMSIEQIRAQAQDIIVGQMRAVIATMSIEQINRDRQEFMHRVNQAITGELEKIGLTLINVNIRDIEDESGYIKALGRKAAAEAVNQANIDVAEQDKRGQIGVAERERDRRGIVAAAMADAQVREKAAETDQRQKKAELEAKAVISEKAAEKERRQNTANLEAEAIKAEAEAHAQAEAGKKQAEAEKRKRVAQYEAEAVKAESEAAISMANYLANKKVAEENARSKGESAAAEADGNIKVAKEIALKKAEEARALRESARLQAEVVVPAEKDKEKILIEAEAKKLEAIKIAEGEAQSTLAKMNAEAQGTLAILEAKARGYQSFIKACGSGEAAAAILLVEKLADIAKIQAQAIKDLPIEKIFVWDTGNEKGGIANLGQKIMGILPPMHELAKQVGLEMPEFLGKFSKEKVEQGTAAKDAPSK